MVANQPVDVHFAKRHIAHEFDAHHDHACDPEENNVEAGDQNGTGVKFLQRIGLFRPAQGAERP